MRGMVMYSKRSTGIMDNQIGDLRSMEMRGRETGAQQRRKREPSSRGRYGGRATRATGQSIDERRGTIPIRQASGPTIRRECGVGNPSHNRAAKARRGPPICFCETNPPFFESFYNTTAYAHATCDGNERGISVGSFSKTNPPGGGK
jgi:hypothetical protein